MNLSTNWLILEKYIFYIIGIAISIFFIIKILKLIIKKENIFNGKSTHEFGKNLIKKYSKYYNTVCIILMSLWIVIHIWISTFMLAELLNIFKNKYQIVECVVNSKTLRNDGTRKSISCKTDNNTINFTYIGSSIEEGTKIKVYYYKHIEIGQITEIIQSN